MGKNPYYPPIGNNIHYKYQATPSVKGTQRIRPLSCLLFSQKETDLGIRAATGEAPAGPSSFLFFLKRRATSRVCRPTQHQSRSGPTTQTRSSLVRLKKGIISWRCLWERRFLYKKKTYHSVTDGINPEHK